MRIAPVALALLPWLSPESSSREPIKVGLIGLDTSHVTAFTALLNDPARPDHIPGLRIVAGYKGGSPDVESSATRIERFTSELRDKWKVEIVPSIEELLQRVDAVMLTSVDGRTHLAQVRPVFAARKPVFIDKPLAASYEDAREIVRLAKESGTPFFSTSSLRFVPEIQSAGKNPKLGPLLGAVSYGPAPTEPHHPDLFWYGIHAVEILYTAMGPGCVAVSRTTTPSTDIVVGRWRDGRLGVMRGTREGARTYGVVTFGGQSVATVQPESPDYRGLAAEIVKFFQGGPAPVAPEETLEMFAFMQAADLSKARGGAEVDLALVTKGTVR
jgi:hypothetical protein